MYYRCNRCQYSANIITSIHTHYKIKHPEAAENPDFEEKAEEQATFSQEFWKAEWNIPTLAERKEKIVQKWKRAKPPPAVIVADVDEDDEDDCDVVVVKAKGTKRKKGSSGAIGVPKSKKGKRQPAKRKARDDDEVVVLEDDSQAMTTLSITTSQSSESLPSILSSYHSSSSQETASQVDKKAMERIMEISPFEVALTYKCLSCPKRSQNLDKLRRHVESEHPEKGSLLPDDNSSYKVMTRDQVVDMLTLKQERACGSDLQCFYCDDVVGGIHDLKAHFTASHRGDTLKVKSTQGVKGVNGYLECAICGHLTPGFERSKQKVHFHEEHPLEDTVNTHKYVLKSRSSSSLTPPNLPKTPADLSRFNGTAMRCPRDGCEFEARSVSAVNSHLRRHTQTFKCGHCGKTHSSSSEFHRHSAMMHGDKIPDQIKDPEAEAELEALKALLEADLLENEKQGQQTPDAGEKEEEPITPASIQVSGKKQTARKSTSMNSGVVKKRSFARKSTGGSRRWGSSSYGQGPFDPPDLSTVTTRMALGGMVQMTVSAQKMSELVNLSPKVMAVDIKSKLPS